MPPRRTTRVNAVAGRPARVRWASRSRSSGASEQARSRQRRQSTGQRRARPARRRCPAHGGAASSASSGAVRARERRPDRRRSAPARRARRSGAPGSRRTSARRRPGPRRRARPARGTRAAPGRPTRSSPGRARTACGRACRAVCSTWGACVTSVRRDAPRARRHRGGPGGTPSLVAGYAIEHRNECKEQAMSCSTHHSIDDGAGAPRLSPGAGRRRNTPRFDVPLSSPRPATIASHTAVRPRAAIPRSHQRRVGHGIGAREVAHAPPLDLHHHRVGVVRVVGLGHERGLHSWRTSPRRSRRSPRAGRPGSATRRPRSTSSRPSTRVGRMRAARSGAQHLRPPSGGPAT